MKNWLLSCLVAFCLTITGTASLNQCFAYVQIDELEQEEREAQNAFFEQTHKALDRALDLFDNQERLPGEEDLAFYNFLSRTKESEQRRIESYLDAAAEGLGISNMSERRNKIADLRKKIEGLHSSVTLYERKKIIGP